MKVFEPFFTDTSKETPLDLAIAPIQAAGVKPQYIVDYGNDFYVETPGGTKITTGKKTSPTDVQIDYNAPGDIKSPGYMVISKEDMTIKALDKQGRVIYSFPIAVGKGFGNKKDKGDMKTPEGEFSVSQIEDSSK